MSEKISTVTIEVLGAGQIASRLKEIADVLLEARHSADYNMGSPRAVDHLLTHVVAALEEIDVRLMKLEMK